MRFGSVCSGIEAASVAWHPLGWRAAWLSEVDQAASNVLAYRFPDVPNLGDMLLLAGKVRRREIEAPDILVGGTPCQSFSVAGMRRGLEDPRGQLTIAFIDLANAIDEIRASDGLKPVIIVWENVPGVLTHAQNPFGCFLAGITGESDEIQPAGRKWTNAGCVHGPERAAAWRVLDAQYFGLAQRRRRVFVVASAREGFDPAAILLEFDGVRRDSPPSREKGQGVAGTLDARTTGGGFPGTDGACNGHVVPADRPAGGHPGLDPTWWDGREVPQTLDAVLYKGQTMPEKNRFPAVLQPVIGFHHNAQASQLPTALRDTSISDALTCSQNAAVAYSVALRGRDGGATAELGDDLAGCLRASDGGGDKPYVLAPVDVLPFDTTQITNPQNRANPQWGNPCHTLASGAHPPTVCITGDVTHTLKAEGFDASEDGTGRGQPIVPASLYSIMQMNSGKDFKAREVDIAQPLMAAGPVGGNQGGDYVLEHVQMAVRRLMPVECERLQGFPDNWTLVPTGKKGKPAADGPRYKQLGNSMATTVMHWIGKRIADHLAGMSGHNRAPPLDEFEDLLG